MCEDSLNYVYKEIFVCRKVYLQYNQEKKIKQKKTSARHQGYSFGKVFICQKQVQTGNMLVDLATISSAPSDNEKPTEGMQVIYDQLKKFCASGDENRHILVFDDVFNVAQSFFLPINDEFEKRLSGAMIALHRFISNGYFSSELNTNLLGIQKSKEVENLTAFEAISTQAPKNGERKIAFAKNNKQLTFEPDDIIEKRSKSLQNSNKEIKMSSILRVKNNPYAESEKLKSLRNDNVSVFDMLAEIISTDKSTKTRDEVAKGNAIRTAQRREQLANYFFTELSSLVRIQNFEVVLSVVGSLCATQKNFGINLNCSEVRGQIKDAEMGDDL